MPGGRSRTSTSRSPHTTSPQNCLIAPLINGPLHTTGESSSGNSKLMDIAQIPLVVSAGSNPTGPGGGGPCRPNSLGIDGPVMSASSTPTFLPCLLRADASKAATEDLPTPPLPLITATTRSTWLRWRATPSFCDRSLGQIRSFSSGVISLNVTCTSFTASNCKSSLWMSSTMLSRSGQANVVRARVSCAVPFSIWMSCTIPSSTKLRPSSGSCTFFRAFRI